MGAIISQAFSGDSDKTIFEQKAPRKFVRPGDTTSSQDKPQIPESRKLSIKKVAASRNLGRKEADPVSDEGLEKDAARTVPVVVHRVADEDIAVQNETDRPILGKPQELMEEPDHPPAEMKSARDIELDKLSDQISLRSLRNLMSAKYAQVWIDWEPETLWLVLQDDFSIEITDNLKNKVLLLKVLLKGESAWDDWFVFQKAVVAINGRKPNFHMVEHVSPLEIAWAVHEMLEIDPAKKFSEEVCRYIAAVLYHDEQVYAPNEFFPESVQIYLTDDLGVNAGLLKATIRKWQDEKGRPLQDLGRPETAVDVQIAHLLEIRNYVKERMSTRI